MSRLRTTALLVASALAASAVGACGSPESRIAEVQEAVAGSSVLLVAVDGFSASHSSTYRYERETTPQLSKLAAEGVRFSDATAGSPSGFASTTTLLFGEALDFVPADEPGEQLPGELLSLAEAFQKSGYRTIAVSTDPLVSAEFGLLRGFDVLSVLDEAPGSGVSAAAMLLVEQALTSSKGAPLFTYVHLGTARTPRLPEPTRASALLGYEPEPRFGTREFLDSLKNTKAPKLTLKAIDLYDAVLLDVDHALGQWLELLESTGRAEETLVILTGINGQAFGQRGRFGVGSDVYQEQVSVPLVMRLPGGYLGGQVLDEPVAVYDLYPTLANLLRLESRSFHSGNALTPLMVGDFLERSYPVTSRTVGPRPEYGMRLGHFKLIQDTAREESIGGRLQHLERDPLEQSDYSPQRPETLSIMQSDLRSFRAAAEKLAVQPIEYALSEDQLARLRALGYSVESPDDSGSE